MPLLLRSARSILQQNVRVASWRRDFDLTALPGKNVRENEAADLCRLVTSLSWLKSMMLGSPTFGWSME